MTLNPSWILCVHMITFDMLHLFFYCSICGGGQLLERDHGLPHSDHVDLHQDVCFGPHHCSWCHRTSQRSEAADSSMNVKLLFILKQLGLHSATSCFLFVLLLCLNNNRYFLFSLKAIVKLLEQGNQWLK